MQICIFTHAFNYTLGLFSNSHIPIWLFGKMLFIYYSSRLEQQGQVPGLQMYLMKEMQIIDKCYKTSLRLWCVRPQQIRRVSLVLKENIIALILYMLIYECKAGIHSIYMSGKINPRLMLNIKKFKGREHELSLIHI